MVELTPHPFGALVHRMLRELDLSGAVFGLPASRFYPGDPDRDFSVRFHDAVVSSPLGPAAGPHTQMAQNLVLAWLGGSRILELKTVQIQDALKIPRPCIDMRTVGYNVEWSQELGLEQSLEEYVKGAMLIEMLRESGRLPLAPGFDQVAFDMSVGYDLEGIRSDRVGAFLRTMVDARPLVDGFRRCIPAALKTCRDLDFPTRLAASVTLSTFHGCPPEEVEKILEFLLESHRLHCTLKFNPTLLGKDETLGLLHDELGYRHIRVPDSAFDKDLRWEEAVALVDRLGRRATGLGLSLGVKFCNTLVVKNTGAFLPRTEKEAYLSGPPLHVLAMHLVRRFRRHFGDRFPVSFSAGIDRTGYPGAVALGLTPVTTCTDLLKTHGYGRLQGYHRTLAGRMEAVGAKTLGDFCLRAFGKGKAALDKLDHPDDSPIRTACLEALASGGDLRAAAGGSYERWVSEAVLLNTEHRVEAVTGDPRYALAQNARPPRKIGTRLELFDCIACDKCVPVCPNNAVFPFTPLAAEIPVERVRSGDTGWTWHREKSRVLEQPHQIATFADFCNECGNCDVFCPEDGGPHRAKPLFFGSEAAWRAFPSHDGFHVEGATRMRGRFEGKEFTLEVTGGRVLFSGDGFRLAFDEADPEGTLEGNAAGEVDLIPYHIMRMLLGAVLDPGEINYVNTLIVDHRT